MLVMFGLLYVLAVWSGQRPVAPAAQAPAVSHDSRALHRTERPAAVPAPTPQAKFGEYPCDSPACAEHRAGFRWAEEHAVADPDNCTGNSGAFVEGCRVFAETHSPAYWIDPVS